MKLIGNLKKQVEKAETKNEKKSLIKNAGMLLNDDELEMVSGGGNEMYDENVTYYAYECPVCHKIFWDSQDLFPATPVCFGHEITIKIGRGNPLWNPPIQ